MEIKMRTKNQKLRIILSAMMALPLLMLAYGCEQITIPAEAEERQINEQSPFALQNSRENGGVGAQLAEVRRHTVHFHDYEKAEVAGYVNVNVGECVAHPFLGGMGYHFVNFTLVGNQENLDITIPQALLYEPQKNGRLRLVAVEYITEPGQPDIEPPVLFGEQFHWNPVFEFWALHAWIWQNNPAGIFEDWNPKVNCDYEFEEE
jgi:hypothetical protein